MFESISFPRLRASAFCNFAVLVSQLTAAHLTAAEVSDSAKKSSSPASVAATVSISLFDSQTLAGWFQVPTNSWIVKDGAMASTGVGRGYICTTNQFSHYRLMFTMRHVSGQPDHQACVLIFCTPPPPGEKGLDALGGIQFQVPNGGHWDYRPGHNNNGGAEFKSLPHPRFDPHEWSRVELLVNARTGVARMAVAQPVGAKAVEVLDFNEPTAGCEGPIAWQMHNRGLCDEYKDVTIQLNPAEDDLRIVK